MPMSTSAASVFIVGGTTGAGKDDDTDAVPLT